MFWSTAELRKYQPDHLSSRADLETNTHTIFDLLVLARQVLEAPPERFEKMCLFQIRELHGFCLMTKLRFRRRGRAPAATGVEIYPNRPTAQRGGGSLQQTC